MNYCHWRVIWRMGPFSPHATRQPPKQHISQTHSGECTYIASVIKNARMHARNVMSVARCVHVWLPHSLVEGTGGGAFSRLFAVEAHYAAQVRSIFVAIHVHHECGYR